MIRKVRSYMVFATFWYKMIMFLIVPVALLGLQTAFTAVFRGTGMPVILIFLVMVETVGDTWFLGGIQEKGSENMDYLKTSPKGMEVLRSALTVDLVRHFLTAVVIYGLSELISRGMGETGAGMRGVLLAVLLTYDISVLGIFLARFASLMWLNLLCGYIGSIAGLVVFLAGTMMESLPAAVAAPVYAALAILGAGLSVLAVKIPMLKMEGSYYDK